MYMHVGELDESWVKSMQEQAADFKAKGYSVRLTVEKDEQHVIRSLNGPGAVRLFEEIEEKRPACAQ